MRRWLWLLCGLLLWARVASPAASIVQSGLVIGSGSTAFKTVNLSTVTAGSVLVAACTIFHDTFSATNPALSDSLGNPWTVRVNIGSSDPDFLKDRLYIATALSPSGGTSVDITCDPTATGWITLAVIEIAGLDQGSPVDQTASCGGVSCQNGFATVYSGTTGTTGQADELVLGAMLYVQGGGLTITPTAPCTQIQEHENYDTGTPVNVCYDVVSSVGTQQRTWTLSGPDAYKAAGLVTFRVGAAPVAGAEGRAIVVIFP